MSTNNDNEIKRRKALIWGLLMSAGTGVLMILFLFRIWYLQNNSDVEIIEQNIISKNYREATLKAARGNLYASDGSILATTVMRYDVYVDFKTIKDTLYENHIGELTDSLSLMFGKPRSYFRAKFDAQRKKQNQYYALIKGLDFDDYDRIRKFPIFKKGKNKGGFIVDRRYKRELATAEIGAGTIGMDDERGKAGLEAAFSEYLTGIDGTRMEQRVNSNQWKPIGYWDIKEPVDGKDVYTTLDLRIQDIAHSALQKQLVEFNAHHGSVLVMEVETGKVRAMVNLRRDEKTGEYVDAYNYALRDVTEPGSTFKVVSLLAAMDDGFIDENTTVNTNGGTWTYAGQRISDSHHGGNYEISDVLAQSSNVGTAKLITKHYASNPNIFINHLKRWKMFDKLDIELPVAKPSIITPEHKKWNKATLASLSYGYASSFSLLQLLTFYNGIANKGKMVKPLFIDKVMKDGETLYEANPEIMVNKMASEKAITMMTNALTKAVEKGTARSIFTPNLKMAGKTGTARFEYWKKNGPMKYQASFAGFYPSDNPKYSCVVMINQPQGNIYGGRVAAPVFKEIVGKTFLKMPLNVDENFLKDKKVSLKKLEVTTPKIRISANQMPNIVGMIGKDVIPQLENLGYRVEYKGVGKVLEQFPTAGTIIKKDQKFYLTLQN